MSSKVEAFTGHWPVACQNGFRAQSSTDLLESWYIDVSRIVHYIASFFGGDGISDADINSIHSSLKNAENALYDREGLIDGRDYYSKGKATTSIYLIFSNEKIMARHYSNAVKKINELQAKTGRSIEYILALVIPDDTNPHQKIRDYQLLVALNDLDNRSPPSRCCIY